MSRTLPVLAVTGAVLASLGTFLVTGELFHILFPVLAIVTAVLLVLERDGLHVALGVVLALGGILGFLAISPVTTESLDLSPLHDNLGPPFVVGLGLWVAGAALALLWDDVTPRWLAIAAALVTAAAYFALYGVDSDTFGSLSDPAATVPVGLFVLLAATPGVLLLSRRQPALPIRDPEP